jgi:transposase
MNVQHILSLLPDKLLIELAEQTNVNRYSKKLQGELIFKLLLHCILSYKDNSLRTMQSAYESMAFNLLNAGKNKQQIRYSSISERLSSIRPEYFEKIYTVCLKVYGDVLSNQAPTLFRFDSTIIALSAKLLKVGYCLPRGDASHMRQLKFTMGFSELPVIAHLYTQQQYTSENAALKETILSYQPDNTSAIRIFDRGITSRKTHDRLTEKKIPFISRINADSKLEPHTINQLPAPIETKTLLIYSDRWVYLFSEGTRKARYPIRCISATQQASKEEIKFVSNVHDLSATEIAHLYKQRWDIEVFFKFLKQELNFTHLINRSENGIRVMLYVTLIAATLLLVYKKQNNLTGYKIMKQQFLHELEKSIVKNIVIMCGGNPKLADKYLHFDSS